MIEEMRDGRFLGGCRMLERVMRCSDRSGSHKAAAKVASYKLYDEKIKRSAVRTLAVKRCNDVELFASVAGIAACLDVDTERCHRYALWISAPYLVPVASQEVCVNDVGGKFSEHSLLLTM